LNYQPRRYSCPAFMARKASRVVRSAGRVGLPCRTSHRTQQSSNR